MMDDLRNKIEELGNSINEIIIKLELINTEANIINGIREGLNKVYIFLLIHLSLFFCYVIYDLLL